MKPISKKELQTFLKENFVKVFCEDYEDLVGQLGQEQADARLNNYRVYEDVEVVPYGTIDLLAIDIREEASVLSKDTDSEQMTTYIDVYVLKIKDGVIVYDDLGEMLRQKAGIEQHIVEYLSRELNLDQELITEEENFCFFYKLLGESIDTSSDFVFVMNELFTRFYHSEFFVYLYKACEDGSLELSYLPENWDVAGDKDYKALDSHLKESLDAYRNKEQEINLLRNLMKQDEDPS